jgi:maleylpyruvate isomerase
MSEPTAMLLALRASTADLLQALNAANWSDDDLRAESLCAGWTRGHVLTHIARNADAIADTLSGAVRGEIVERYPGGTPARNAAIADGAERPFAAQVADVRESAERLDRVFGAVTEAGAWDRVTDEDELAAHWAWARWREVEIHRVDLASDYGPDRWPPAMVTALLPEVAQRLTARVGDRSVLVRVTAEGSLAPDHVGAEWAAGDGRGEEVSGPDWAVLAWLVGRGAAAGDAVSATPSLAAWR